MIMVEVVWIGTDDQTVDSFTKNLCEPIFEYHICAFVTYDKKQGTLCNSQGKGVGDQNHELQQGK